MSFPLYHANHYLYYRQTIQVTIGAYSGQKFDGRPESRGYELHLFGCWPGELHAFVLL